MSAVVIQRGKTFAYLDCADDVGSAMVDGREWRWEFHRYSGPLWLKKNGEPRKCQHPQSKKVWEAFEKWLASRNAASGDAPAIRPLPCAFCGRKPKVVQRQFGHDRLWVVECNSNRCCANPQTTPCDNSGTPRGRHGAIAAWNRRPNAQGMAAGPDGSPLPAKEKP